jgi:hypothetical protein
VIIDDLDFMRVLANPHETDAVLIIYADTELTIAIGLERLEAVPRRLCQVIQILRIRQILELALGDSLDIRRNTAALASLKQLSSRLIFETGDHVEAMLTQRGSIV